MSDVSTEKTGKSKGKAEVLRLALARFEIGVEAFSDSRTNQLEDLKFAAGSPDNNYQWPEYAVQTRGIGSSVLASRPTLTLNFLPQHIRQVTNDERQNRPVGKVIPASGDASVEVAEVFNGLVRSIQNNPESPADIAYDTACENQVVHGEGYWRICTDYVDERSFDQEAFLEAIPNSFSVYMDPTMKKPSGEDAKWAMVTEDMASSDFEEQFPDATAVSGMLESGINDESFGGWVDKDRDTVRIAEYYCYENKSEKLYLFQDGAALFESEPECKMRLESGAVPMQKRMSLRKKVKYYKLTGYEILEEKDWVGSYIPIVRVIGNAFIIDGKVHISGLVRNAKDAQRMINYWNSQECEMLALAPKAPFIGAAGQFENFEDKWGSANTNNWPYLEYNPVVDEATGQMAPPPQRSQPPMVQSGIIAAKQGAMDALKATTGQYAASLGQPSNERSGKAILARQREGDIGTFQYVDNLSRAIRWTVRQLIDIIPKIYDTRRVARILGEDNETAEMVELDPNLPQSMMKVQDENGAIRKIYNPSVGKYDVVAITGPGYTTKRQESLEGAVRLVETNPAMMDRIGDKVIKMMDWPDAQAIAKQFKKGMDPKLFVDDDNPALQQANQQIQQYEQQLQQAMGMLQKVQDSIESREVAIKEENVRIAWFKAETERFVAVANAAPDALTAEQVQDIAAGTVDAALDAAMRMDEEEMPQMPPTMPQQMPQEQMMQEGPQAPPMM